MEKYKMIALDMDGTLLNSSKVITPKTLSAIEKAFNAGKEVVLSTGRCIAELKQYINQMPRLRYIVGVSGALVYDLKEDRIIYDNPISDDIVLKVLEIADKTDVMVHLLTKDSIVQKSHVMNMEHFNMGVYIPLFESVATPVENISDYYKENLMPVEKLNLYHANPELREETRSKLQGMLLELANAEETSLELSAIGTTKGTGLMKLCQHLKLDMSEVISVGDADNDLDVLSKAGLAVAMKNANDNVKKIADVIVADCDNDGVAEAIEKYLLP